MRHMLVTLLERPTFEEQFPDQYVECRTQGKIRMDELDALRGGMCFADTLKVNAAKEWYNEIC